MVGGAPVTQGLLTTWVLTATAKMRWRASLAKSLLGSRKVNSRLRI
jgi:hypothetical protein